MTGVVGQKRGMMMNDDLISRHKVIDVIIASVSRSRGRYTTEEMNMWLLFLQIIQAVPSAERKGKWIKQNVVLTSNPPQYQWHCSECGRMVHWFTTEVLTNYCPNCGADMRGEKDG